MISNNGYLPGQHGFGGSHRRVSENFPSQLTPPVLGEGLVHVLVWLPSPQKVLHLLQEDQSPIRSNFTESHSFCGKIENPMILRLNKNKDKVLTVNLTNCNY